MRKFLLASALLANAALPAMAQDLIPRARAQGMDVQIAANVDPLTHLPADKWIYVLEHEINAANLIGKNSVYILNATGEDLAALTCRGYYLVGPKPQITDNKTVSAPSSLPKWTATLVPTETFNTYCTKSGIGAQSNAGGSYHVDINSGSFQDSTFLVVRDNK